MRVAIVLATMAFALAVAGDETPAPAGASDPSTPRDAPQLAALCMKTGEQVSGTNKICYYQCPGSTAAITVKFTELCPLSINQ